jgi:hypothetical protein
MPETAGQIIRDAMKKIGCYSAGDTLDPDESALSIRTMNRMFAAWESQDIKLGHTPIANIEDTMTIPAGAIEGVIHNLAVKLAPDLLEKDAPQSVIGLAISGKRTIGIIGTDPISLDFPSTLPMGSGNRNFGWGDYRDSFYSDATPRLFLTSTGETVTIVTKNVPVAIGSNAKEEWANWFDVASGVATVTKGQLKTRFRAEIYCEVAVGVDYLTFYIAKNGVIDGSSAIKFKSTAGVSKKIELTLNATGFLDDNFQPYAENNDTTANITINSIRWGIF